MSGISADLVRLVAISLIPGNTAVMAHAHRSQTITIGSVRATRFGVPSPLADLYYKIMEMSWPAFVGSVCLVFVIINLAFGLVYTALPGAIAHARAGSLADGIFFSIDTLATVGYGFMYPATHVAHAIAATEILLGLFFSATITGLVFARFSRPRIGLAFSRCMVIGHYDGQRALMLRVVSVRSRPLADADAQLAWLQTVNQSDGSVFRRLVELDLVYRRNPMLGLAWTLVHLLEDDSPVLQCLQSDEQFMISAMVRGTDTFLATPTIANQTYGREDIRVGHEFADMLSTKEGTLLLDMTLLHETRPSTLREAI